jgi:hypothetical protein
VSAMRSDEALPLDRIEFRWLDGVIGVLTNDSARVQRARRELLADTAQTARGPARALAGLWLMRPGVHANEGAAADTLRAVTDDAIRSGDDMLLSVEGIDRMVVARALRRRGSPGEVERYLMWIDASTPIARDLSAKYPLAAMVSYERAAALEEAGDRSGATYWLRRFLTVYDQPPPQHRGMVEDAKHRLAQLEGTDAPRVRTVAPR